MVRASTLAKMNTSIPALRVTARAMQTSAALGKLIGGTFITAPAVPVEEFDKLIG